MDPGHVGCVGSDPSSVRWYRDRRAVGVRVTVICRSGMQALITNAKEMYMLNMSTRKWLACHSIPRKHTVHDTPPRSHFGTTGACMCVYVRVSYLLTDISV